MRLKLSARSVSVRLLLGLTASAMVALALVVLPAGTTSAAPRGGTTGEFSGLYLSGKGADTCSRVEERTKLSFDCKEIRRNFIGSYVIFHLPKKNFNVQLQLGKNSQDRRQGLNWYEQGTTTVPQVYKFGEIRGTERVDVNGQNVPYENTWDLGLDKTFGTTIGLPPYVSVLITITLIQG